MTEPRKLDYQRLDWHRFGNERRTDHGGTVVGFELKKVEEVVDAAVKHTWGVPEFQRGFVWTRQKVRDLVESLWKGYPVGSFLLWYAPEYVEPQVVTDGAQ